MSAIHQIPFLSQIMRRHLHEVRACALWDVTNRNTIGDIFLGYRSSSAKTSSPQEICSYLDQPHVGYYKAIHNIFYVWRHSHNAWCCLRKTKLILQGWGVLQLCGETTCHSIFWNSTGRPSKPAALLRESYFIAFPNLIIVMLSVSLRFNSLDTRLGTFLRTSTYCWEICRVH